MNLETFYTLANALIAGSFIGIRIPFIIQSIRQAANALDRWRSVLYSFFSAAMAFVFFLFLIAPESFSRFSTDFPDWLRIAGVVIGLGGDILLLWTHFSLDTNFAMYVTSTKNHRLVTNGPYARVRHPMYTAFLMTAAGFFLVSSNLFFGGFFVLIIYPLIYRMNIEEKYLSKTFGEDYQKYMSKTKRLIPFIY